MSNRMGRMPGARPFSAFSEQERPPTMEEQQTLRDLPAGKLEPLLITHGAVRELYRCGLVLRNNTDNVAEMKLAVSRMAELLEHIRRAEMHVIPRSGPPPNALMTVAKSAANYIRNFSWPTGKGLAVALFVVFGCVPTWYLRYDQGQAVHYMHGNEEALQREINYYRAVGMRHPADDWQAAPCPPQQAMPMPMDIINGHVDQPRRRMAAGTLTPAQTAAKAEGDKAKEDTKKVLDKRTKELADRAHSEAKNKKTNEDTYKEPYKGNEGSKQWNPVEKVFGTPYSIKELQEKDKYYSHESRDWLLNQKKDLVDTHFTPTGSVPHGKFALKSAYVAVWKNEENEGKPDNNGPTGTGAEKQPILTIHGKEKGKEAMKRMATDAAGLKKLKENLAEGMQAFSTDEIIQQQTAIMATRKWQGSKPNMDDDGWAKDLKSGKPEVIMFKYGAENIINIRRTMHSVTFARAAIEQMSEQYSVQLAALLRIVETVEFDLRQTLQGMVKFLRSLREQYEKEDEVMNVHNRYRKHLYGLTMEFCEEYKQSYGYYSRDLVIITESDMLNIMKEAAILEGILEDLERDFPGEARAAAAAKKVD